MLWEPTENKTLFSDLYFYVIFGKRARRRAREQEAFVHQRFILNRSEQHWLRTNVLHICHGGMSYSTSVQRGYSCRLCSGRHGNANHVTQICGDGTVSPGAPGTAASLFFFRHKPLSTLIF